MHQVLKIGLCEPEGGLKGRRRPGASSTI